MAYMDMARKTQIAKQLSDILLQKWDVSYSLRIVDASTLVMTIVESECPFIENFHDDLMHPFTASAIKRYAQVNVNNKWYRKHFTGECLEMLDDIQRCLNNGYGDPSTDNGWFIQIDIGTAEVPYRHNKTKAVNACRDLISQFNILPCEI
jgi:hypothetical protein